ncbi:MAG: hypothetical protein KDD64_01200 [Bdellovibrionales bacterium]|nr:hypothetical protein [Bdellovibrionales bacterium]
MNIILECLVVCPETASRARLKDALSLTKIRTSVTQARDLRRATEIASKQPELAVVFMHSTLSEESIRKFQEDVAQMKLRYRPIFVVTLHTDHLLSEYISEHMLNGIEGFLSEPFATTDVDDVIQVAFLNRQKQVEAEDRNLSALKFMMHEGLTLIDNAAIERVKRAGRGGGFSRRRMNRLKLRLRSLGEKVGVELLLPLIEESVAQQIKNLDITLFHRTVQRAAYADHPGKVLTEIIEARALSPERLCELVSGDAKELLALLDEKGELTPKLSRELARVIGNTPNYWLSLQTSYDNYVRTNPSARNG